jgi:uncharacterized protein YndB with AHSA1/START domain
VNAVTDLTIDCDIVIEAPIDIVWRTISEPDQIRRWFADQVELDLRPGGDGNLHFDQHASGPPVDAPLVVQDVEPPNRLTFRWAHPDGDLPDATNSVLVEFTLTAQAPERTHLRLVETGVDTIPWTDDDKATYVREHNEGWAYHFGRLAGLYGDAPATA